MNENEINQTLNAKNTKKDFNTFYNYEKEKKKDEEIEINDLIYYQFNIDSFFGKNNNTSKSSQIPSKNKNEHELKKIKN